VLKYIDEFTAASEGAAEYVSTLTDASISIITNGIDLEVYKEPADFHDHRRHKTILYVGRLEGRKGVNYLIRAFKQLTKDDPNVSLVIAGNGPDREKLESLVEELKADNVSFLGFVSDQQKLELLHSADLFCAPAVYGECFGIVLVEAMASGLVIVAGDNPGYAGVMKGLGALSLVDPHRIEDFARRLKLLLFESALRQLWRDWAREEILQYSYKHITDQYEAVYAKALREASPKS
jgi:phosphatidyl-myo-inositol alpha-mannosyltransferase